MYQYNLPVTEFYNSFPRAAVDIWKDNVTGSAHVVFQVLGTYKEWAGELKKGAEVMEIPKFLRRDP